MTNQEIGEKIRVRRKQLRLCQRDLAKHEAVFALIECSMLSEECKEVCKECVKDRARALPYSIAWSRGAPD
jgi:hypothetical protein